MLEALERLLFFSFEQNKTSSKLIKEVKDAAKEMSSDQTKHDAVVHFDAFEHFFPSIPTTRKRSDLDNMAEQPNFGFNIIYGQCVDFPKIS